ncbi:MAG: Calx-beta domain-containing protein [Pseudomonadota bacterium]
MGNVFLLPTCRGWWAKKTRFILPTLQKNVFGLNLMALTYSFQVILIDRSDIGAGEFDIEYNYEQVQWETGNASGGNSVRVGYSNGSDVNFELEGSAVNGALIDGGPNALIGHELNSGIDSRYLFFVRGGLVPGTLQFSGANYSVNENGGSATITVTRVGGSSGAISVGYSSTGGTATAGGDYLVPDGVCNPMPV